MGYQVRIIQYGGSNLIITKHARPKMLIHSVTVTERETEWNHRREDWNTCKERNKTAYKHWREEWRSQGEEAISPAQLRLRKIENKTVRENLSRRWRATQAKCLKWITVGQTSEEDKTANMSHCSLLAFNNRCLVSPSLVMVPHSGWSDLVNE